MNHNNAPSVDISDLTISYKDRQLFEKFDFHLQANQCTCLLGPSGVGKTTILKFIADIIHTKEVNISGAIAASDGYPLDGRLTYMTQHDSLLPWLNILDNVLIGYHLRNQKITEKVKWEATVLFKKVGLKDIGKMYPKELSVGMRQRVSLVRTLIEDRQIVLMDEPFSALDVITKFKLQNLASKLLSDRTVLLITHDPLEALRLSDAIYILSGSPVKISNVIRPQGKIPRDSSNPDLIEEQARLLKMIAEDF